MTHTIESLLALADTYAQDQYMQGIARVSPIRTQAREALRAALTEALAQAEKIDSLDDFEVRGKLAAGLQCWHRLTGAEAQNLIDFFANHLRTQQAAQPVREPQFMEEVAYEHIFADGSKVLSYALSSAGFPPRTDAERVNLLYYSVDGIGGGE
jgi:hypothetical protein